MGKGCGPGNADTAGGAVATGAVAVAGKGSCPYIGTPDSDDCATVAVAGKGAAAGKGAGT